MNMGMARRAIAVLFVVFSNAACSHWTAVGSGLDYARYRQGDLDAHVTRIDLREPSIRIVASDESARGATVGELADRYDAIVAINADYFDESFRPVGLAIGECGPWESAGSERRQWVIGFSDGRAEIFHPRTLEEPVPSWVDHAVSGWPLLVDQCRALSPEELPGSDFFTRAPHPRTAVGIDREGKTLFFVVVDGRRPNVPGVTLARLGQFMRDQLGACSALNLDGGGSTEMVVNKRIVNQPSDGEERRVGNHVAVVSRDQTIPCEFPEFGGQDESSRME